MLNHADWLSSTAEHFNTEVQPILTSRKLAQELSESTGSQAIDCKSTVRCLRI